VLVASDVPAWLARLGSLRDQTRPGGHRKSRVLHVARLKGGLSTTQPLALPASPFVLRSVNFEDPWAAVSNTRRGPLTRSRSSQGPLRFEKSKRADNLPSRFGDADMERALQERQFSRITFDVLPGRHWPTFLARHLARE